MNFFKLFKKQLKSNPITILIFITIFFISSLGLSLLVSTIHNFTYEFDDFYGSFEKYTLEVPFTYGVEGYNNEKMLKALSKIDEEFRVRTSLEYFKINGIDQRDVVIAEGFKGNWGSTYPILEGTFYTEQDIKNGEKVVLLGKNIAKKYLDKENKLINIDDEEYKVIGIVGYKGKESAFDNSIFMPITALSRIALNSFESIPYRKIYLSGREKYPTIGVETVVDELKKQGSQVAPGEAVEVEKKEPGILGALTVYSGELLTVAITIIFAILNVILINYFWIKDRRFEIGVRKAFGIKNKSIALLLVCEFLSIVIVASILTIITHITISLILNNFYSFYLSFNIYNILAIIIFNIVISSLVSILPIKKAMAISPIEIVKGE